MTHAEIRRGRGRPRTAYDETELAARIEGFDDLFKIQDALERNGNTASAASGAITALARIQHGDPTGGVSERTLYRYRQMLGELGSDPLRGPGRRRRSVDRNSGGTAQIGPLRTTTGSGAMVCTQNSLGDPRISPAAALQLEPPIMLRTQEWAPEGELREAA